MICGVWGVLRVMLISQLEQLSVFCVFIGVTLFSLGELFLGLPLFPGSSVFNMICRISEMLDVPPDHLIERSRNRGRFFTVRRGI